MSWLKDLLGKEIRTLIDSVETILPMRKTLRIIGSSAISAEDNPTAGTTDLYIAPSGSLSDVLSAGNDAGGKTIENLDEPFNSTDAATKGYVDNAVAVHDLSVVLEAGNDAGGKTIENLDEPFNSTDAATKGYVDNAVAVVDGGNLVNGSVKASKIDLVDVGLGARRVVLVDSDRALQASDAGAILIPSANVELTIPTDASDPLPNGFTVQILQTFSVNPARLEWPGIDLFGSPERRTYFRGDRLFLVKADTNTWNIYADCSESGTYEPVISNTEHYAASTARGWWTRTGRIVSVGVHITGSNTATTAPKHVEISLPLPRILSGNFSGTNQVGGSASWGTSTTASISPAVLRSASGVERVYVNAADTDGSNPRNAQATFTYDL